MVTKCYRSIIGDKSRELYKFKNRFVMFCFLIGLSMTDTETRGLKEKVVCTHPLRTPRTRFNIKKDPTTMRGIKKTPLKTIPTASLVCK